MGYLLVDEPCEILVRPTESRCSIPYPAPGHHFSGKRPGIDCLQNGIEDFVGFLVVDTITEDPLDPFVESVRLLPLLQRGVLCRCQRRGPTRKICIQLAGEHVVVFRH
ncbi:hypothetical protein G352_22481 [Rhodococcus ruber BKS 20-38]|uniref:Uncharacterized protein n=1 Tax=Rhodococcus ruber BKS 20-38 TaxID=1278076 RepID=M2X481_9NOCA|nr:hypothetical protein G352_22481 [Rhodococcus ruber BKS 20-38]